jgi:sugar-specific transcriptional regulator TrmB
MKELEKRLNNIHKGIEKFLSLQSELTGKNVNLDAENQELAKKIEVLEQQLKKLEKDSKAGENQKQTNNIQKNQLINNKIDELLSEVEQCMTLLKK